VTSGQGKYDESFMVSPYIARNDYFDDLRFHERLGYNRQMIGEQEVLLTAAEVAKLFRVGSKTINRWATEGKLTIIKTAGRHYRYKESEVKLLLESYTTKAKTEREAPRK